jgi:hypothetical protein
MSAIVAPRCVRCTGLLSPSSTGPIASAPPIRLSSLYAAFDADRLGKISTFAGCLRSENG